MSGLDKQFVPVNLGLGLDLKTDPKKVVVGKLLSLQNAVFQTPGQLRKRAGYDALLTNIQGSSSSIASGNALSTFKSELTLFSLSELYSYSASTQQWSDKGSASSLNLTVNPVIRNSYQQTTPNMAYHSAGIKVFTWEDGRGGSRYSVVDAATGQNIVADTLLDANAALPRAYALGSYVVIFYQNTSTFALMYIAFSALSPTVLITGSPFTASSTLNHSNPYFDCALMNGSLYFAYNNTSGGGGITVQSLSQYLLLSAPAIITGDAASTCINVAADSVNSQIWVTYYNGTSVKTFVRSYASTSSAAVTVTSATPGVATVPAGTPFSANQPFTFGGTGTAATGTTLGTIYFVKTVLTSTTFTFSATSGGAAINTTGASVAPITYNPQTAILTTTVVETLANVRNVAAVIASGTATIYYEVSAVATYNYLVRSNTCTNAGVVGTAAVFLRSVGLAAKPFVYNSANYLILAYQSVLQPTYFVVDASGKVIAKFSPSNGGGLTSKNTLPETTSVDSGIFCIPSLIKDQLFTVSGAVYTQTGVLESTLDFTSQYRYLTKELANNLHVSGGILSVYDGTSLVEQNFHLFPENISASTSSLVAGSVADGTYLYAVCYEWTDNQGQIQRSAPSTGLSHVVTGGGTGGTVATVTVTIPTLRLTAKQGSRTPVRIVVYRTENAGTIYYQISSITSPTLNSVSADTVTFADTFADASIIGNPLLYTTGDVVENLPAPALNALATYKNRLVGIPAEDQLSFWYSKQVIPGYPVEFNDTFVQTVDIRGGNLTALAQMDSNLILFKNDAIFQMAGDGPELTGANNNFTQPQLITTDSGSITPVIVVTPIGLMYKSRKGIYLIDRSMNTKYIGAAVEAYNGDTVVSGTQLPDTNQIRFCLDTGVALVYDYYVDQWSVFTNHAAVGAVIFDSEFTYLKSNGVVMQEDQDIYTDSGQFIPLKLVTSWLSFGGLQAYQRMYRMIILGEYFSPHNFIVQIAYDFNPQFTQLTTIDAGSLLATTAYGDDSYYGSEATYGGAYPTYQFQVNLDKQKCSAVQISLEDSAEVPYGQGLSLSAIGFIAGIKKGFNKLPATRRFG